jgi:hypothetical protein
MPHWVRVSQLLRVASFASIAARHCLALSASFEATYGEGEKAGSTPGLTVIDVRSD